jgi:RNA polymerase primary sigma factor
MTTVLPSPAGEEQPDPLIRHARTRGLLTREDETRLAKRIERGDTEAKQQMIESNLRLVFAVARAYRGRGTPYADLVQEGTIGLIHAVEKFDYRRELKFSTYAVWWIRRSILDAVGRAQLIRIPPKARRQMAAVHHAADDLEHGGERPISSTAIAQRVGLKTQTVQALRAAPRVTVSLDEPLGDDLATYGDMIADERIPDPSASMIAEDQNREVGNMLRLLPARHREVVMRRYGLGERQVQSHEEIGRWLGVGEERSRQIEREALHRLRVVAERLPDRRLATNGNVRRRAAVPAPIRGGCGSGRAPVRARGSGNPRLDTS